MSQTTKTMSKNPRKIVNKKKENGLNLSFTFIKIFKKNSNKINASKQNKNDILLLANFIKQMIINDKIVHTKK